MCLSLPCWQAATIAGIAVLPYLLLTVVFVSLGPLLYLVIRGVAEGRQP